MKYTIIGVMTILVIGGIYLESTNQATVVEKQVEHVEVQPEWAKDEDAVKAAQDVIRKKELEAEEAEIVAAIKAEQAAHEKSISEKQNALDEVRKELESY